MKTNGYTYEELSKAGDGSMTVKIQEYFADRAGVKQNTLYNMLHDREQTTLDFDICDRLMCALGGLWPWLCTHKIDGVDYSLASDYRAVNLRDNAETYADVLAGVPVHPCSGGHKRTPQNTKLSPLGILCCQDCNRERMARYRKGKSK